MTVPPTIHTIVKKKVRLFFFQNIFLYYILFYLYTMYLSTILSFKARLGSCLSMFFFCFMQTFFTYYVSTMKKHECDWVLNVATCTEWPVMAKHQNILIWRNFFPSLNDKWLLLKWPTIPQMMWHICGIECFNKANPLFEQYW